MQLSKANCIHLNTGIILTYTHTILEFLEGTKMVSSVMVLPMNNENMWQTTAISVALGETCMQSVLAHASGSEVGE